MHKVFINDFFSISFKKPRRRSEYKLCQQSRTTCASGHKVSHNTDRAHKQGVNRRPIALQSCSIFATTQAPKHTTFLSHLTTTFLRFQTSVLIPVYTSYLVDKLYYSRVQDRARTMEYATGNRTQLFPVLQFSNEFEPSY